MKNFTALLLAIFCIVTLATGCGSKDTSANIDQQAATAEASNKKSTTDTLVKNNLQDNVYINKDYSFQYTLPSTWIDNCKISEKNNSKENNTKFEVAFLCAPKDEKIKSEDMQTLVTFYVVTKDDWAKMDKNKEQEPPIGAYLGEKNDLVYLFSTPQSNPYDAQSKLGKIFDKMFESRDIKNNFKIIK